ncbi:probable helicase senataxin isoform X2 [Pygocentrus nattereri]|uniref:AAA+ ATPase domain-containing protein n=1 Tax=Pygocentrus nattereri TaxID=42514 RepID=A0A3B4DCP2_PYGNA|nr:probable helicase senataxin isoform X2 [Pygocentrus nattereri]
METCRWCRAKSSAVLTATLQRYCTGGLTPEDVQEANTDLLLCTDCVAKYHEARDGLPSLHKRLWELETTRLLRVFQEVLETEMEEDDLYYIENGEEQPVIGSAEEICDRLRSPFVEVLKFPYLLCHRDLCETVVSVVCKMNSLKSPLQVVDKHQGIYLLMVHPNETVRRWAISTARSLGRVDRDCYYEIKEVFSCMFYIIELGISLDFLDVDHTYHSGRLQWIPTHLYDSKNEKNYWLGICMLLMQLDSQAMDSLFMGPEKQGSIPQCIINTMGESRRGGNADSDPFWPAFHCFMVILDRLGSKIWCQIEPADAFATITQAASYIAEIENIRQKTSGTMVKEEPVSDDDMISCSQIVYDCYPTEQANRSSGWSSNSSENNISEIFEEMGCLVNLLQSEMGQGMRVYGSTFLWFIPFVHSVMELGELGIGYIDEVIHYLHNEVNKDVLAGQMVTCDKVTEFFIRILVVIIELLICKGCMRTLYYCASTWVKVVVQCSALDETCSNRIRDRRGMSHRVTSFNFGRGNRISATGVGAMSLACMKLIRSLLKEGERIGVVPKSDNFQDILNRHLREIPPRVWCLRPSESENLQKFLIQLVKAIMDEVAAPATVPSAPPTPPADPPENPMLTDLMQQPQYKDAAAGTSSADYAVQFIKDEPLWEYEKCQDDFCDNLEDVVKAKKEPSSPVQISEFQPALDLNRMKPDLGKIQEIRSRLNDNQNLSKMQAIASRRPNKIEQKRNGCCDLKEEAHTLHLSTNDASQSAVSDSAKVRRPSKKKSDDYNEDEPLDVHRSCPKKSLKWSSSESESEAEANDSRQTLVQIHGNSNLTSKLIISDDNVAANNITMEKDCSSGSAANRGTIDLSSDPDLNESPSRDYDAALSESQVFEFETQEYVASAWDDRPVSPVMTNKPKCDTNSKASHMEAMTSRVSETQPVTDEDIEKACQQVEEQIIKKQHIQTPPGLSIPAPTKPCSSTEKWDSFIQQKSLPSQSPTKKPGMADKGRHCSSKKSLLIEPLCQIKKRRSSLNIALAEPSSSVFPNTFLTPAIVPPKKVRKPVEPQSVAERMGLKKKERKAFDLSQRSLDTLGELRTHGQKVHVEPPQKTKRVRRKSKPQPKLAGKGGKKLLASQDLQYFRQSRGMLQKSTPTTVAPSKPVRNPVPETLSKSKYAVETVEEPEAEEDEDDYQSFLPCSQPDPARRTDQTVKQAKISAIEFSRARSVSTDVKCSESGFHQDSKVVDENAASTADCTETERESVDDEWMYLTQNEPTDMELCSQLEQMEALGENTQREPVDMDIDADDHPDTSANSTDVYLPRCLSTTVPQTAPFATSTHNSVNNTEILPSMTPLLQKKAKPSTTKIYAASSRSASLVVEMEKTVKPPLAANVIKTKVARPLPAMPPLPTPPPKAIPKATPQHEFRQPLSRPPRPLNQPIKSVVPHNIASHPPSYKTYSRPEDPVSVPRPTVDQPQRYDQSVLTQAILKWEYRMFENYETFGTPNDLCPLPLKEVPTRFSNYEEYFNIMYPLLLINAFDEMASEWLRSGRIGLDLKLQGFEYSNRTATASFAASLNSQQEMRQLYPKDDDLVLLWLPENSGAYTNNESGIHDPHAHFGCVSRSNVISNGGGQPATLNLTIQTRGNVSSVNIQPVRCEVIGSLISTVREFRALCLLRSGIMARPHILLTPHVSVFTPSQEGLPDLDMPEYNVDQTKAISCGVSMVRRQQKNAKILLINGPPGTGKSKTIVGLLQRLFSDHSESAAVNHPRKSRRMRVLLCAPSNAAVDSLMKKVIPVFKEKCRNIHTPQGNCGDINLVRLGSEKTISKDLIAFSLDRQTAKKTQMHADSDVQRQKEKLDQNIESLSRQCARTQKQSHEFKQLMDRKQQCLSEREKLSRQLKEFRSKRQEVQAGLLRDAHVICCTLSTSGSTILESAFRRLGHEPFSCVIVDEAGQAKEPETLIPLLHRCPSFILVGDPAQLPPTVVSQKAKELGYGQSLMARLCKSLHQSNPSSSIFLSTQYRMHPDICEFPSKYIYNKNLKNDCETAQKRCSFNWPFEPYRVFDVTDGRESKIKDSFYNLKEVKLVLMLLKQIGERQVVRVGVITPYNAQKQRILEAVNKELGRDKFPPVDVDTVDGFQGREMDCVIVSCVRASSEAGSIGFVANRQRMNVTITRAKYSLFILGHLRTLREQSGDWGALIKDAACRGTIIKTQEHDFREATTKIMKPDLLFRSLSHPPTAQRHGNPTSPSQPPHIPMETAPAPVSTTRCHPDSSGNHSPTVPLTTSGLMAHIDWLRDPRLSARSSDPRLQEPIRDHRQDRERRSPAHQQQHPPAPRLHRDAYRRISVPQPHSSSAHSSRSPRRRNHERHWSPSPHRRYKRSK